MTPQQRDEYVEAVMLNVNISGRAAARIVDRVITPALAFAWAEGNCSKRGKPNPYQVTAQ